MVGNFSEKLGNSDNNILNGLDLEIVYALSGDDTLSSTTGSLPEGEETTILVGGLGNEEYRVADNSSAVILEDGNSSQDILVATGIGFDRDNSFVAEIEGRHLYAGDTDSNQYVTLLDWQKPENRLENFVLSDDTYSYEEIVNSYRQTDGYQGNLTWEQLVQAEEIDLERIGLSPSSINNSINEVAARATELENSNGGVEPPTVINPIADLTVSEDTENQTIDLTNVFSDPDGDAITITVQSNSNPELVVGLLENQELTLDFLDNQFGTAEITIRATADEQSVDDSFTVTVNPVDDPPLVANIITDITVNEDAPNQTLDLSDVFEDIDSETIELVVANNSNSELVTLLLEENNLTLDFLDDQFGTAEITIRATADGQSVEDTFTVTVNAVDDPGDDSPVVANPIRDITVEENVANQTIDLSDVFQDIDSDTIELEVIDNTNSNLVMPLLEGDDLTLDFLDNQSGTAEITIRATADGQSVEDTFTVTVNPALETIELFRFRNTTFSTGTYVFVGAAERDAILADENLSNVFSLDGRNDDGTINPAFVASLTPRADLIPFFRLESLTILGTFLFVSTGEYEAIFAEDSDQKDQWKKQGFDENNNDIPEFYLLPPGSDQGIPFNRYQNLDNNTFLYAGPGESDVINNDPNLSNIFRLQGGAFNSLT